MAQHTNADDILVLHQLSKWYEEAGQRRTVLYNITARFARGAFVVLLGKSGSGKSTLLNLVGGIDVPSSGTVLIGGHDITTLDEQARTLFRRQHIGFVFQFFNLLPTLTVLENVLLPLELNGRMEAASRGYAHHLLEQVGLADRAATYPDKLSGGEQQRIAIARALVHDPLLVLADEPTGNLDVDTSRQVLALLDRLTRQAGKNLLMVTHSLDAVGLADQVYHLRDGQLVEGPPYEVGQPAGMPWARGTA